MSRVLVIGCGGVASVAIHKICQVSEVFADLCIASRTVSKCDKLAAELKDKTTTNITTAQVDADNTDEVIALITKFKPDVVLNVALPYQDLTIMDACLACKVPYVDTAKAIVTEYSIYDDGERPDQFGESFLTPSLAGYISSRKFQYCLPLYRLETILRETGVPDFVVGGAAEVVEFVKGDGSHGGSLLLLWRCYRA